MKTVEVMRRYAAGERDFRRANLRGQSFREQDLSGADFSEADIRGANFTNTTLRSANFQEVTGGLQKRWSFMLYAISLLLSIFLGFTASLDGYFIGYFFLPSQDHNIILGLLVLIAHVVFFSITVRGGVETAVGNLATIIAITGSLAVTGAGAVAVAAAVTIGVAVAFVNASIFVFTFIGVFSNKVAIVSFGAIALAASITFTFNGTAANAFALAFTLALPDVSTVTGTSAVAIAFTIIASLLILGLSCQVAWRTIERANTNAQAHQTAVKLASAGGTSFRQADLTDTNFTQASLKNVDLRGSNLTHTCWLQSRHLDLACIANSYLQYVEVRQLLITGTGQTKKFDRLFLEGIGLRGAKLKDASFIGTNLNYAALEDADLSRAILKQAQLDGADLTQATLTGAYIEDWGITGDTKLDSVRCEYVYMRVPTVNDPNPIWKPDNHQELFTEGDFADFIKPIVDTLDLYHNQGVDPRSIAIAFKDLAEDNPEAELEIVALEKRGEGKFLLRAKTTEAADKSQLSAEYFDRYNQLKALSEQQQALLIEKDSRIQQLATMVVTSLQRSTFYSQTTIQEVGIMTNNPGGISQFSSGQMSGSMQAAIGNQNTQTSITDITSPAATPDAPEVLSLLTELETLIQTSALPAADKAKATTYLESAKTEAAAAEPDKEGFAKDLERAAKTLKSADEAMQTGTSLFGKVVPIFKAIAPWVGTAAGALLKLLP